MIICVIPARSGSMRFPRQYVRLFAGRPVLHYAIDAAQAAGLFDRIVVATDCGDIAREARIAGADVCMRPTRSGANRTGMVPIVVHALLELGVEDWQVVAGLHPATPLIQPERLRQAFQLLRQSRAPCVFSVMPFSTPNARSFLRHQDGRLRMVRPESIDRHRKEKHKLYQDAAQFHLWDMRRFLVEPALYPPGAGGIVVGRQEVQDIGTEEGWTTAERLYAVTQAGGDLRQRRIA